MDTDRITRSNRTHLQQTLTTQNLQIANCSCRQATHKRPACLTNMIGGRRTLQTYIATIKHDYLLFEDSIVSLSRRENTNDHGLVTFFLLVYATKSSQSASSSLQHKQHGTSNTTDSAHTAHLNCNSTSRGASKSHKTNRLAG